MTPLSIAGFAVAMLGLPSILVPNQVTVKSAELGLCCHSFPLTPVQMKLCVQ